MGLYHFRLPDIGEGVAEAEIVVWHIKPGDVVKEDQSVVDVMTDKATVDMTSPVDGQVVAIHGEVGQMLPVGSVLIEFIMDGEGNAEGGAAPSAPVPTPAPAPPPEPAPLSVEALAHVAPALAKQENDASSTIKARVGRDAPVAAPATRRRAYELGVPLQFVPGTGPGGRITPEDLERYLASGGDGCAGNDGRYATRKGGTDSRIVGMRRKIAEKMQDAKRRIPHITYVEECDLTELEALRVELNARRTDGQTKLTLLPFFIRALVRILPDFPHINARYDDEGGVLHQIDAVHVGIATQTPSGLMVPVIRHAETRDIWGIATELARVSAAARDGGAGRDDLSGSTITITSLGPLGGITTTPIINHPEVAIIGPNKLVDRPSVQGPFVSVRKMMNLSSSFDHRIVDGYDAALFIQQLRRLLEHPALIFMD